MNGDWGLFCCVNFFFMDGIVNVFKPRCLLQYCFGRKYNCMYFHVFVDETGACL